MGRITVWELLAIHERVADEIVGTPQIQDTTTKVQFVCNLCYWVWTTTIASRIYNHTGCPACAGRVMTPTSNFLVEHPDMAAELVAQNGDTLLSHSRKKQDFQCATCDHVWSASPHQRRQRNGGCPQCKKPRQGGASLTTTS